MQPLATDQYFKRFAFCGRQIATPPHPELGLVVVIPCFNEPDLIASLESLRQCERPDAAVEVIVVVNSSGHSAADVLRQNQATIEAASSWIAEHRDDRLAFQLLHCPDLPTRHAGVGLARKIGMDEALRRLGDIGASWNGIIVGYDADCRCESSYLRGIEGHFREHQGSPACSIHFAHPLDGTLAPRIYEAVAAYELHLRYYVQALRYAGFPHAHHTLGSCMAVRAEVYLKQGGMNKRQAGEDFYFLHKLIPLGGFTDLTTTTVFPSPRDSDRVPFGTGRAVSAVLAGQEFKTYPLDAFIDLKKLVDQLSAMSASTELTPEELLRLLPESVRSYLLAQSFPAVWTEIRAHTSGKAALRKRFFRWFDGFKAMKFIHHARDRFYGARNVEAEARILIASMTGATTRSEGASVRELLAVYRELDRKPWAAWNEV